MAPHAPAAPAFTAWLDDFFASYYRHRPVNATFVGVHQHDHRLPDFSESGAGAALAEMQTLLSRLQDLPPERLSVAEAIDRSLAGGFLRIQAWEYQSSHFHRGNPATYTGEAVFGVMSLFLNDFAPLAPRVEAAVERLHAIPGLLAQGQANVRQAPLAWTKRAIRECQGALAFLGPGVDHLIRDQGITTPGFRKAASRAAEGFAAFQSYLERELSQHQAAGYSCGAEVFDLLLRQGHFLDMEIAEVVEYGEAQMAAEAAYLDDRAADFNAATRADALAQLAGLHPTADAYYARFGEVWQACRETAVANRLLTWPDFPIEYVPRPAWAREAAPYLYFLFYRAPAAFQRPPVHQYLVAPLPDGDREQFLRANNDSVIKLNHVVHHGSIGHHVQNWHACQAPSRIGQVAAVDCASRIAMFCGGTMAEGWACYATDLMDEVGFLTPLESYAEHQSRLRMAARAVVDCQLHTGQLSLEEAADFYVTRVGMGPEAARGEAVKNSMFPGAAMMYLFGTDLIHNLRREMAGSQGDAFDLAQFHDRFLSYGSIPVALIAADMKRQVLDAQ